MTPNKFHACPICAEPVPHWERYPRAICRDCSNKAADIHGQHLSFSNIDFGGGFRATYTDAKTEYPSHICYVDGIECWADEARFGGIVIQAVAAEN
ncbi:hypothetical protein [Picosynechococcus sp. PCC 7117]|uniref:hypothetical protein n=1 Tax=Picosynechococcus sp. PCC 7117 TaxID=195498 RepID=UPI000810C880|nr:hypothetical protein [Picosynechococcus sp. PCC 7117]ANV89057.1 hypothetical protein AWQ22_15805 [Picosynechococcus sp. PCC 7117]